MMRTLTADHVQFARAAGLRYMMDGKAGIRRRFRRGAPLFVDDRGRPVRNAATLARFAPWQFHPLGRTYGLRRTHRDTSKQPAAMPEDANNIAIIADGTRSAGRASTTMS